MAKILIVDDQKSVLITLESILTGKGHFVASATSAYEALEKVATQKFDLLITDAIMPGGKSGFELTRTLRASQDHAGLPIIILTGKREKADVQRGIEMGANDYIVKPLDPEILMAKVNSILSEQGKSESGFPECHLNEPAKFEDQTTIIGVSEVGMTLVSNVSVAVGSKIKIKTDLFEKIGIETPYLRVVNCSSPDKDTGHCTLSVQFVGLSEKEFKPIRLFVASKRRTTAA